MQGSENEELKEKISNLGIYGVLGGFIVPGIFYSVLLSLTLGFHYLTAASAAITLLGGLFTYGFLFHVSDSLNKLQAITILILIYGGAGGISICALVLMVLLSGGPLHSPFSGFFLYVPAVVALIVQRKKPVIIAAVASASLMTFTAFCGFGEFNLGDNLIHSVEWSMITNNQFIYKFFYLLVFGWQLLWAVYIAIKTVIPNQSKLHKQNVYKI